jgi:hypothetical protein
MVLYSKVGTIRNKQLQEKKLPLNQCLKEQKQHDLMMEIDLLKALKVAE